MSDEYDNRSAENAPLLSTEEMREWWVNAIYNEHVTFIRQGPCDNPNCPDGGEHDDELKLLVIQFLFGDAQGVVVLTPVMVAAVLAACADFFMELSGLTDTSASLSDDEISKFLNQQNNQE